MKELKSAFELANERIILSRYQKPKEEDEPEQFDFVTDFRFPAKESFVPVNMDDESEEESPIMLEDKKNKDDAKDMPPHSNLNIKEAESIVYDEKPVEVHWYGDFLSYTGFARMNRSMVFGLSDRMARVKIDMLPPNGSTVNESTKYHLDFLSKNNISPTAPKVYGATVPLSFIHGGKKIFYTMIETSGGIHKQYMDKLMMANEVWVPTNYGKSILQSGGVKTPIKVMPLGVDVNRYKPGIGKFDFGSDTNGFVFLSVFRWSYRKGFDILIQAFIEEFSSDDDVTLLMVSRWLDCNEKNGNEKIKKDFAGIRSCMKKSDEQMPHIMLYNKPVHESHMPSIYNSADAFVLMSRGEGFGLPFLEAGSSGLPVIATKCSGHSDFINEDTALVVEPEKYVEVSSRGEMAEMAKLCHFYEGQKFPFFGRKSINLLRQYMRWLYENKNGVDNKVQKFRRVINENYSWNSAVDRVYDRIKQIS